MERLAKLPLVFLLLLAACEGKIDSPFGTQTRTGWTAHNARVIERLAGVPDDGTPIRIGIVADSHQNHADFEEVLAELDAADLDFIVHLGDFTNIGSNSEYDAFVRQLELWPTPVLVVVGNHDAVGAGLDLYRRIFGEFNSSFVYRDRQIILYNSNSLDFVGRDGYSPAWLDDRLTETRSTFLFQHVNEDNPLYFSAEEIVRTRQSYVDSPGLRAVFHGHLHQFAWRQVDDVDVFAMARAEGGQYGILEIDGASMAVSFCRTGICDSVASSP